MKLFIICVTTLLIFPFFLLAKGNNTKALRILFYKAERDSKAANMFYDKLLSIDESSDPLLLGYKGMASFMLCYHSLNPYTKVKHFLNGRKILNQSINSESENLELRFLRFTIQTSAPEFLAYNNKIVADKNFILDALKKMDKVDIDQDLYKRITDFMLKTKYCNADEKNMIKGHL